MVSILRFLRLLLVVALPLATAALALAEDFADETLQKVVFDDAEDGSTEPSPSEDVVQDDTPGLPLAMFRFRGNPLGVAEFEFTSLPYLEHVKEVHVPPPNC